MYCLFGHFVGKTNWLYMGEITKIAASFHCYTYKTFNTLPLHNCGGKYQNGNTKSWKISSTKCGGVFC